MENPTLNTQDETKQAAAIMLVIKIYGITHICDLQNENGNSIHSMQGTQIQNSSQQKLHVNSNTIHYRYGLALLLY